MRWAKEAVLILQANDRLCFSVNCEKLDKAEQSALFNISSASSKACV